MTDSADSADSAQPAFSHLSTARVSTDRPSRYGKQLAAHMGRKITSSWDETAQTGSLTFDREGAATGSSGSPVTTASSSSTWPQRTSTLSASSRSPGSTWRASAPRRALS